MSDDCKKLTDWARVEQLIQEGEAQATMRIDQDAFERHCRERVKGQDDTIKAVTKLIRLEFAKAKRSRPIANLLFLGPTGTGKTELAKAINSFMFEGDKAMVRFDCSEFSGSHSKDRLVGMPTGYVGAEQGGQLTRPILENPKRVVLFDEIEKADPSVFDLFLQLMGEGRLTEQQSGKTADFTQSVIVLTSNALSEEMVDLKKTHPDPVEQTNALKSHLANAKVFRPEILGRLDKVCIFNPLQGTVLAEITIQKIAKIAREYQMEVEFIAPEAIFQALEKNKKVSRFGVRELERILFDAFAESFAQLRDENKTKCKIGITDGQLRITGS